MKKIMITFVLGLAACLQAHAEWFIRGTHNSWAAQQMEGLGANVMLAGDVVFTSDGSYKFDRYGDWSENYGQGGLSGSNIPIAAGKYNIEFYTDTKGWIAMPQENFFRGTPNNWAQDTLMQPVPNEDNKFETCQDFSGASNPRFKIDPNGNWGDAVPSQDYIVSPSWVHIIFDARTGFIQVEENLPENCNETVTIEGDVYFLGSPNAWEYDEIMSPVVGEPDLVETCQLFFSGGSFHVDVNGELAGGNIPSSNINVSSAGWKRITFNLQNHNIAVEDSCANTVNDSDLITWWHNQHEVQVSEEPTPVANEKVRRSSHYNVRVAKTDTGERYDSFVYMSVPRNGMSTYVAYPSESNKGAYYDCQSYTDTPYSLDTDYCKDGADFVVNEKLTMSWTSFHYSSDAYIYVASPYEVTDSSQVIIRPTNTVDNGELGDFEIDILPSEPNLIRVFIPYSDAGHRISIEFTEDYYTSYNQLEESIIDSSTGGLRETLTGSLTTDEGSTNAEIHSEPRNSLLVFAEPFIDSSVVPDENNGDVIYQPSPGFIQFDDSVLTNANTNTIYFEPGIYYMGSNYHAKSSSGSQNFKNIRKIYLAPGAYVKGAFDFDGMGFDPATSNSVLNQDYVISGSGVLSGEQYVYEAYKYEQSIQLAVDLLDTLPPLSRRLPDEISASPGEVNCHGNCLKLLQFYSMNESQSLTIEGVTIANPPFHSLVVYGNENSFITKVNRYKQVGAWYWQTDGLEIYSGVGESNKGEMFDSFVHANDDAIKLYHSNVEIKNTVVWAGENGAVIQFGWESLDLNTDPLNPSESVVDGVDVIHNRMYWQYPKDNSCIISASKFIDLPVDETEKLEWVSREMHDVTIKNVRSEGKNLCAMRLNTLNIWRNINIENLSIEEWNEMPEYAKYSTLDEYEDRDLIGNEMNGGQGVAIFNFQVGNQCVSKWDSTWDTLGFLNFGTGANQLDNNANTTSSQWNDKWNAWCP